MLLGRRLNTRRETLNVEQLTLKAKGAEGPEQRAKVKYKYKEP